MATDALFCVPVSSCHSQRHESILFFYSLMKSQTHRLHFCGDVNGACGDLPGSDAVGPKVRGAALEGGGELRGGARHIEVALPMAHVRHFGKSTVTAHVG
jgi:hypothetical protein